MTLWCSSIFETEYIDYYREPTLFDNIQNLLNGYQHQKLNYKYVVHDLNRLHINFDTI